MPLCKPKECATPTVDANAHQGLRVMVTCPRRFIDRNKQTPLVQDTGGGGGCESGYVGNLCTVLSIWLRTSKGSKKLTLLRKQNKETRISLTLGNVPSTGSGAGPLETGFTISRNVKTDQKDRSGSLAWRTCPRGERVLVTKWRTAGRLPGGGGLGGPEGECWTPGQTSRHSQGLSRGRGLCLGVLPLDSCPSLLWPLFVTRVDQLVNPGERCCVTAKETPANTKQPPEQARESATARVWRGPRQHLLALPRGPRTPGDTRPCGAVRKDSGLGSASVPLGRDLGRFQHHTLRDVLGPGRNSAPPTPGKSSGARTCQPGHRPLSPACWQGEACRCVPSVYSQFWNL